MPRRAEGLSSIAVRQRGPGRHYDGDGLVLLVRSAEIAFWEFHFRIAGKRRSMGLGRARGRNAVGLAEARGKAAELRRLVKAGTDPIAQAQAARAAALAAAQQAAIAAISFKAAAKAYIDLHGAAWRGIKTAQAWENGFHTYTDKAFGDVPVANIAKAHVTKLLIPLWKDKPDVASRLRTRIAAVLDFAKAQGWRSGDNPADWRGNLKELRPKAKPVAKHHAALPWREAGSFMAALAGQAGVGAQALRFTILTAARSGEARGATWAEIDMANAVWVVPAERMKTAREHRVPLSEPALAILRGMLPADGAAVDALVFPGGRAGQPLGDTAPLKVLSRMGRGELTVHGFRSTFRDWCAERANAPRELAEAALAHAVGDKTEAAYFRGDLFDRRRRLMAQWAEFCGQPAPAAGANVVALAGAGQG